MIINDHVGLWMIMDDHDESWMGMKIIKMIISDNEWLWTIMIDYDRLWSFITKLWSILKDPSHRTIVIDPYRSKNIVVNFRSSKSGHF